jgi:hypothetical protein
MKTVTESGGSPQTPILSHIHSFIYCLSLKALIPWGHVARTKEKPNGTGWEKRLLYFLELSGVGRVMENRDDEEESRAIRLDG